jgi:hypothetical protein
MWNQKLKRKTILRAERCRSFASLLQGWITNYESSQSRLAIKRSNSTVQKVLLSLLATILILLSPSTKYCAITKRIIAHNS